MPLLRSLGEAKANLLDVLAQVMEYHREEARKNPAPGAVREELQLAASRNGLDIPSRAFCGRRLTRFISQGMMIMARPWLSILRRPAESGAEDGGRILVVQEFLGPFSSSF